jgi:ABC-type transporter Mla maintaining outer membrane lipid asymmetry permease subunit MlaE
MTLLPVHHIVSHSRLVAVLAVMTLLSGVSLWMGHASGMTLGTVESSVSIFTFVASVLALRWTALRGC